MPPGERARPWADLPMELVDAVVASLDILSAARLTAVCTPGRFAKPENLGHKSTKTQGRFHVVGVWLKELDVDAAGDGRPWRLVTSLGDGALFLGANWPLWAAMSRRPPGQLLQLNRVHVAPAVFGFPDEDFDVVMYDFDDGSCRLIKVSAADRDDGFAIPIWFKPTLHMRRELSMMATRTPAGKRAQPWADLPPELVDAVVARLDIFSAVRLAAVHAPWARTVVAAKPSLPFGKPCLLALHEFRDSDDEDDNDYTFDTLDLCAADDDKQVALARPAPAVLDAFGDRFWVSGRGAWLDRRHRRGLPRAAR
ncbi:hypothetical protein BAE44_0002192 [Dichanthelium oligosanthes]|uniref:F-box domain-containing protein n=1 Tax=Dichanthelium oligosanthes TaxID=888268 RepID=A0A1E5WHA6_9POAL|nr:hypothetical protein BAE44_0002192 [Dichanthelium oligosanthes]